MNKIKFKWAAIFSMVVLLSSCTVNRLNYTSTPVNMQVNLDVDDLELIDEVTGIATQSYVLGLPIGGKDKYNSVSVSSYNGQLINLNDRGINNALFNALADIDQVDLVLPVTMYIESDRMFLGRNDSVVVRLKAYKIK